MNFAELCTFFETLRSTKIHSEKSQQAKAFLKKVREDNHDLFTIVRLVLPKLDRDRPSYRIKESKIAKLLISMLGLPPGNDKNLLLSSVSGSSVDFGDVIFSVLKKYIVAKETGMGLREINAHLDKIANRTTDIGLDDAILNIFRKLSPKNIKWLIQIILKDLKLGISDNSLLNCVHEDGANFYATNNNLKKLCEVLRDPQVKLHELEINMFEAFRPMLSKRCDAKNFRKCFPDTRNFLIENKFDGERFQLHFQDGKFKYLSRNGYNCTESYGESFAKGAFTPFLKRVFDPEVKRVILDGEMMLWNKHSKNFGSKGMNFDVKKLKCTRYQPCFCVFDILLHNDRVLTNLPLEKRLSILKRVVRNPIEGTIVVSEYQEGTRKDIVDALNLSVDKNEEGIVVKDTKSVYKCGDRNSGWFKLKMEYFDDVIHDLDVLMMGGFYGANRKVTSLMVGILSGEDTFWSLGSISSGLKGDQWDILRDKFQTQGVSFDQFSVRTTGKLFFGRERPDVYIEPENSLVLQIRASELIRTASDQVKCPYTLRFPRVLKIRDDKPVNECLSMNELLELAGQNKSVIKLNKRHIEMEEITAKARPTKKVKIEVVKLEEEEGDFLLNKKFYVDSGTESWPTEEIYHSIKKCGGEVSYRLEKDVDVVLISKITPKISSLMEKSNRFDIIHVDWMKRVLGCKELVDYNQDEIFYCGANFQKDVCVNFDRFGDSYKTEATGESLKHVFEMMKQSDCFLNTNDGRNNLFSRYVAYFDSHEEVNNSASRLIYYSFPDEMEFRYYGGRVEEAVSPSVNLIVIEDNGEQRRGLICTFLKSHFFEPIEIVCKSFISEKVLNL